MIDIDVTKGVKGRNGAYILTGRDIGIKQRDALNLDNLEKIHDVIVVITPESFEHVNSSFFLGLFGKSVRKYGGRDGFLKKYNFKVPKTIMDSVEEGIKDAMRKGSGLDV